MNDTLKGTLDSYAKDLKDLVAIKPKQFDTATIATMITALPARKWNAAQGVVDATILKKAKDNELKVEKAKKRLVASHSKDSLGLNSADDRTAWVDSQEEVQKAEIESINADAELVAAKLAYECLDDLFTAGKKIMDFLVEQDRATKQYNRFVDEARSTK